ncbi:cobalamin biosynthesis protein CbiM [Vibrio sp. HA2012]|uniref:cobalt transporter CbiM n=1 Tax=Vibrio sp. HA2012 TaxID=1971595 RepID=UPI000C2C4498|nr:cobalt transporter CbiM [Vibrio sp. HA2012]PJC86665.1 cobalamin biosynthesis protein CbiM [Vibrio sp. HA2012]
MHIVDGVLSVPVLAAGAVITLVGSVIGLRQLTDDKIPQAAVLAACFFVASLIHIPIGPSSVHLIFNGLIGLLLGWGVFPVVLIGLVLQAVFFGFGGIVVLGVNTINIAVPAVIIGMCIRPYFSRWSSYVVGFISGFGAVFLTSLMVALALTLSGDVFLNSASLVIVAHIPVALLEGFICAYSVHLLKKIRPELINSQK